MAVIIGSARQDERGKAYGGQAGNHIFPVIQGKLSDGSAGIAPQLGLGQCEGRLDHRQQGNDDQAEQNDQADQHNHIEQILHHVQYEVLQSLFRQWFLGKTFLRHSNTSFSILPGIMPGQILRFPHIHSHSVRTDCDQQPVCANVCVFLT